MNRKNLTAAVLAGLAGAAGIVGSAQAVNINPDGLGQVLIYPYYTVNAGNTTLLSVVNTSEDAKAIKVRFLEGKNSREVLDFNLYMSPYDVWTASLKKKIDGVPRLKTADNTCTVPYIYGDFGGVQDFLRWGMDDEEDYDEEDLDSFGDISRATEGHFEMIEMGILTDEYMGSASAITHENGGDLPDYTADAEGGQGMGGCGQLVDAWTDFDDTVEDDNVGYWLQNADTDLEAPTGGLFGGAAIVNVQAGTMYSYDAKAVDGFSESSMHFEPGFTAPNLNSGDIYEGYVFVDGETEMYSFYDDGEGRTVDAVSYVFMHDSVMNEYTTEAAVAGATEWVMTFPTKHFYVYEPDSGDMYPVAPFTSTWNGDDPETDWKDESCEVVRLNTIWDRSEQIPGTTDPIPGTPEGPIVSPAPPDEPGEDPDGIVPFELCYETSVIAFGAMGGGILGSDNLHTIDNNTTLFTSQFGWARLDMYDYTFDYDGDGVIDCEEVDDDVWVGDECLERYPLGNLNGLPVTGFAVMQFANGYLGDGADVLANYGGIFQHKYTRMEGYGQVID